jgi:uncharacterized protein
MIERRQFLKDIEKAFAVHSVCGLIGPRQTGKTTLAKLYAEQLGGPVHFFDFEDPTDLALFDNPKLALDSLTGLTVIDEIQRRPELFPYLRVLVDKQPDRKFLILGSAAPELLRQSSETLAGRICYVELTPFMLSECPDEPMLWKRGGFPRSYLAPSDELSVEWRKAYITTFLEMDLLSLGFNFLPFEMRKLWTMLAHYHGNILNSAELGRSLGLTDPVVRRYTQFLEGAFVVRMLQPWHANISKRQVKSPKVYLRDSGLLHSLLGVGANPFMHPKIGASWEGFAIEELIRYTRVDRHDCYFWATHSDAELDLLILKDGKKLAFEFKYTDHPKMTRSMHSALKDLELDLITVIVPMDVDFLIHERVRVMGLKKYEAMMKVE